MVDQTFDRRGNNGSGDSLHRLPDKATRFPIHRSLADFDFAQMKVDESLIKQLATFEFRPWRFCCNNVDDLQIDGDEWVRAYYEERTHSGKYCFGETPMQT